MKFSFLHLMLSVVLLTCTACEPQGAGASSGSGSISDSAFEDRASVVLPYRLDQPVARLELGKDLREVSGLAWASEGRLAAVQDEQGRVYYLDPESGEVLDTQDLEEKGDFEGIAIQGNTIALLRSDGHLFLSESGKEVQEYAWKEEGQFDFEGLCWDPEGDRLLVACKDQGKYGKRKQAYIFAFSLTNRAYLEEPAYTLKKKQLPKGFKASGIALHPETRDVYVLSSTGKALLVLDAAGKVKTSVELPRDIYPQPEGITFAPDGRLFISSEGRQGNAALVQL